MSQNNSGFSIDLSLCAIGCGQVFDNFGLLRSSGCDWNILRETEYATHMHTHTHWHRASTELIWKPALRYSGRLSTKMKSEQCTPTWFDVHRTTDRKLTLDYGIYKRSILSSLFPRCFAISFFDHFPNCGIYWWHGKYYLSLIFYGVHTFRVKRGERCTHNRHTEKSSRGP